MNCKQVKELLPLYVGHDVEEKRAKLVTAHLESCTECTSSADEYRKTRLLLQLYTPPAFNEGVYTGIRQHVLREIRRESSAPAVNELVAHLFRPRFSWAVAAALLLAVSVLALYFIANQRNDRQHVADSSTTVDRTGNEQPTERSQNHKSAKSSSSLSNEKNGPPAASNTGADNSTVRAVDRAQVVLQQRIHGSAADRTRSVARNTAAGRLMTVEPARDNLASPDTVPARDPGASERTLRVEMQTKNPNVRIIWFAPPPIQQYSPGSKGI